MKRGPKPALPSEKRARGTLQQCRDAGKVELIEPDALPARPEWLTAAGEEVWIDDIGRVAAGRLVTEKDSTMFANYCNLQGAIVMAWRAGDVPPTASLMEARKMAEQFGIFGAKSRVKAGGSVPAGVSSNPFTRNGGRG
ncbi:MAG TPA: hypothetical protein VGN75_10095 [Kaistia sp.]|nr:hypothetical protein [Kaistia sp.]